MEVFVLDNFYSWKQRFPDKNEKIRSPVQLLKSVYKGLSDKPILIPKPAMSKHVYLNVGEIPRSTTSVRFFEWEEDVEEHTITIKPLNCWRISELIERFPTVYFCSTTKRVFALNAAPKTRNEYMAEYKNFSQSAKKHEDVEIAVNYAVEAEFFEDAQTCGFPHFIDKFNVRVPVEFVYDSASSDTVDAIEEERVDPTKGLTSVEVCNMIQPEYKDKPNVPTTRHTRHAIRFFYNEYETDSRGSRRTDKNGKHIVKKRAKEFAEEFAYTNSVPIYAFDINEGGSKSYFAATDAAIVDMYSNRERFARRYQRFKKDLNTINCVNEMLMWRWGAKLYADLEAYYDYNPQAVGREDEWTWKMIDFLNEMLADVCKIEGVTRDSWTILEADKKEEKDGKIVGKLSRHAICQDPRVFFKTMLDEQVFYDYARDELEDRIEKGDDWTFAEVFDKHGERALFWDTSVVTFFRCFRMLGSDKYLAGRPLNFHAGCRPEGVPIELACLIQRPIDGDTSEGAQQRFITFDMSGRKGVGVINFEYDVDSKLVCVSRMKGGKRKRISTVSTQQRYAANGSARSTVSPEQREFFLDWLASSEQGKNWAKENLKTQAMMKHFGNGFLIELPRVDCYCYRLAEKGGRKDPTHNSGCVFLIVKENKAKTGCHMSQYCYSSKCPEKGSYYFGYLDREVYTQLFAEKQTQ